MKINEKRITLAQKLFDKVNELKNNNEINIKVYEIAFQDVIEEVFPNECWWRITRCNIFWHLMTHKDPELTITAILKELNEIK